MLHHRNSTLVPDHRCSQVQQVEQCAFGALVGIALCCCLSITRTAAQKSRSIVVNVSMVLRGEDDVNVGVVVDAKGVGGILAGVWEDVKRIRFQRVRGVE